MTNDPAPTFRKVNGCEAVVSPTVTDPNDKLPGETVSTGRGVGVGVSVGVGVQVGVGVRVLVAVGGRGRPGR